jgi:hypothetical protein
VRLLPVLVQLLAGLDRVKALPHRAPRPTPRMITLSISKAH